MPDKKIDEIIAYIRDTSEEGQLHIKNGLTLLPTLSADAFSFLVSETERVMTSSGAGTTIPEAAIKLGVSEEIVWDVVGAGLFIAGLASRTKDPLLVGEALKTTGFADTNTAPVASRLFETLYSRGFAERMRDASIADAVLPSFRSLETVLDMRVAESKSKTIVVPVIVAFLSTDVQQQRLWFQIKKEDARTMIAELQKRLQQLHDTEQRFGALMQGGSRNAD